jgi:two-component system, NarL family, sensor kinase
MRYERIVKTNQLEQSKVSYETRFSMIAPPSVVSGISRHASARSYRMETDRFAQGNALRGPRSEFATLHSSFVVEERQRLAREIHDTLTQDFAGILLHLEAAEALAGGKWRRGAECVSRARELARSGLEDTRRMLLGLRPKPLEEASLSNALRRLAESCAQDAGLACTFRLSGRERELPAAVQDELYRVAQEALCNVRKHARANSAWLALRFEPGAVVLRIKDNGRGFAAVQPQAGGHGYGMTTMRERAHRLGGSLHLHTAPGRGAEIILRVPRTAKNCMERNEL